MVGCSAYGCSRRAGRGFKLFNFPLNRERRRKWIINCRPSSDTGDVWTPGPSCRLCEVHFEKSQFIFDEDGKVKKLKPDAVPTLFGVRRPPQRSTSANSESRNSSESSQDCSETASSNLITLKKKKSTKEAYIEGLEAENKLLHEKLKARERSFTLLKDKYDELEKQQQRLYDYLSEYFFDEQIERMTLPTKTSQPWSQKGMDRAIKMLMRLGKEGYQNLRRLGYPLPGYTTLSKKYKLKPNSSDSES